ncbi:MAG: hypothetical protein PWR26_1201 [Methanosarcinales archaeon]|nr:hypothetical protein [Methanosarcinales archaeon]
MLSVMASLAAAMGQKSANTTISTDATKVPERTSILAAWPPAPRPMADMVTSPVMSMMSSMGTNRYTKVTTSSFSPPTNSSPHSFHSGRLGSPIAAILNLLSTYPLTTRFTIGMRESSPPITTFLSQSSSRVGDFSPSKISMDIIKSSDGKLYKDTS